MKSMGLLRRNAVLDFYRTLSLRPYPADGYLEKEERIIICFWETVVFSYLIKQYCFELSWDILNRGNTEIRAQLVDRDHNTI